MPALIDGKNIERDYLYFELSEYGGQVAIRKDNWKMIKRNILKDKNAQWELYDLKLDIGEQKNLAAAFPRTIKKLAKLARQAHSTHSIIKEWNFMER